MTAVETSMLQTARSSLVAAAICTAGGAAFYMLHVPLPWMTGSLTAAALTAILGGRWFMPAPARVAVRPLVGVLTGSTFGGYHIIAILILGSGLTETDIWYHVRLFQKAKRNLA